MIFLTIRKFLSHLLLAGFILALASCSQDAPEMKWLYDEANFEMEYISMPNIPNRKVSIVDFGAVGDGQTSNTKAIAQAINYLSKQGGGTVVIPKGLWLTGPIEIKSHIELHTERGAVVVFSKNYDDYPLVRTFYEGQNSWRVQAPIFARGAINIALTGEGIFDGSGHIWRPLKSSKVNSDHWRYVVATGGAVSANGRVWFPTKRALAGSMDGRLPFERSYDDCLQIKEYLRPVRLNFLYCKNVRIEGVSFHNTPAWCLHPLMCENVVIKGVTLEAEGWEANGDGVDIESCRNVLMYDCVFDAGDDGICIKSGKDEEGRKRAMPSENILIYNCTVYRGHGGFVVGSEMSGGVRNIYVKDCHFIGTNNGLRFKSARGRGGVVENILISDIQMIDIKADAILYDLFYSTRKDTTMLPVDETTPKFSHIHMKNIYCKGANRAMLLQGLPEMKLQDITLENAAIEANEGILCRDAEGIVLKNVQLNTSSPLLSIHNSASVELSDFKCDNDSLIRYY